MDLEKDALFFHEFSLSGSLCSNNSFRTIVYVSVKKKKKERRGGGRGRRRNKKTFVFFGKPVRPEIHVLLLISYFFFKCPFNLRFLWATKLL